MKTQTTQQQSEIKVQLIPVERMAEDREGISELAERLLKGRDYLMTVKPSDLTVEDCLEAFGFGRNGLEG